MPSIEVRRKTSTGTVSYTLEVRDVLWFRPLGAGTEVHLSGGDAPVVIDMSPRDLLDAIVRAEIALVMDWR